jgi:hypothetical protein
MTDVLFCDFVILPLQKDSLDSPDSRFLFLMLRGEAAGLWMKRNAEGSEGAEEDAEEEF